MQDLAVCHLTCNKMLLNHNSTIGPVVQGSVYEHFEYIILLNNIIFKRIKSGTWWYKQLSP